MPHLRPSDPLGPLHHVAQPLRWSAGDQTGRLLTVCPDALACAVASFAAALAAAAVAQAAPALAAGVCCSLMLQRFPCCACPRTQRRAKHALQPQCSLQPQPPAQSCEGLARGRPFLPRES